MQRLINLSFAMTLALALSFLFTTPASAQQKGPSSTKGAYFVDQNGDGVCDNFGTHAGQKAGLAKNGNGNQNAPGNQGVAAKNGNGAAKGNGTGVCNGTGSGLGTGTGVCDGTGPKGNINRGGKK